MPASTADCSNTVPDGSAIEFELSEGDAFAHVVEGLLRMLLGSDFALGIP